MNTVNLVCISYVGACIFTVITGCTNTSLSVYANDVMTDGEGGEGAFIFRDSKNPTMKQKGETSSN